MNHQKMEKVEDVQIYPFLSDSSLCIISCEYDGDAFVSDPTPIHPLESLKQLKRLPRKEEYLSGADIVRIFFDIGFLEETLAFTLNRKRVGGAESLYKISCVATGYANHHDGYCSGSECELIRIKEPLAFVVRLSPNELACLLSGKKGIDETCALKLLRKRLDKYESKFDCRGSGYCGNHYESESLGIYQHDSSISYSHFSISKIDAGAGDARLK